MLIDNILQSGDRSPYYKTERTEMEQQNEDFWQLDRGVLSSPNFHSPDALSALDLQNQKLQFALEKRKLIEQEINELSGLSLSPVTPKNEINRPPMIHINGSLADNSYFPQDNRSPYANAPQNFGRVKTSKNMLQSYATAPQMSFPGFQAPPPQHQQQMSNFGKPPASPILSYQNQQPPQSFHERASPPFVHRQLSPGSNSGPQHVMSPTQQSLQMSPHVSFRFSPPVNDRQLYPGGTQNGGQQAQNGQAQGGHSPFQTQVRGQQGPQGQQQYAQQQQQFGGQYNQNQQPLTNSPRPYLSNSHSSSTSSLTSPVSQQSYNQYSPPPQDISSPPMYGNVYGNAQIQVQSQQSVAQGGQGGGMYADQRGSQSMQQQMRGGGGSSGNLSLMPPSPATQIKSPPTSHSSPGGHGSSPIVSPQVVYQVQFKHNFRDFVPGPRAPQGLLVGQIVIVQCQRGEDLGVVVDIIPLVLFVERRYLAKLNGEAEEEGTNVTHILRLASQFDLSLLAEKSRDEGEVREIAHTVATTKYSLPMSVVDAEYQFDRQKLTIFYTSEARIDFRELVKELFATFKTRVWMKKINEKTELNLKKYASLSLTTGVWCDPNK